jgi:rRNA processing protein Krr1/Pno1
MSETARQPSWQVFSTIREIPTRDGTLFYLLLAPDRRNVCRIDERFVPLIHDQVTDLTNETVDSIEIYCRPDTKDPCGWRLDVDYYRALATGQTPAEQPQKKPLLVEKDEVDISIDSKSLTFKVSTEDHEFVSAVHKIVKQTDPAFSRFQDFNAYLYQTQIRLLRMQYPQLWNSKESLPF